MQPSISIHEISGTIPKSVIDKIKAAGYRESKVIKVEKSEREHVWDVSLQRNDITLPFSIVTNKIVTHNSLDARYFKAMLSSKKTNVAHVFGIKDRNGKYVIKPRIRYYPENRGELTMDALNIMIKNLPDKELIDGQWYYVFENTRENQKSYANKYEKSLFSKYNKFYIKTDHSAPQAIIVVDSWPSLITEKSDDEESKGQGLGANARLFAEHLPKIVGKLRRKGVILIGVNQLREKPMAHGDPRYEPGGHTLKFQSSVRTWKTARAVPEGWGKNGQLGEEPSVTGRGVDNYRYIHFKNIKNKLSTPYLSGWMRIWVSDARGKPRGIDKAYDNYQYLKMTGQISGPLKKLSCPALGIKSVTWLDFKKLCLLEGEELKKHLKTCGLKEDPKIRRFCQKQVASGESQDLLASHLSSGSAETEE